MEIGHYINEKFNTGIFVPNLFPYQTIRLNLGVGCWQEWVIDAAGTQVFSET